MDKQPATLSEIDNNSVQSTNFLKPTTFSVGLTFLATVALPFLILSIRSFDPFAFGYGIIGGFRLITYYPWKTIYDFIMHQTVYAIPSITLLLIIVYVLVSLLQKHLFSNKWKWLLILVFLGYIGSVLGFVVFPVVQKLSEDKAKIQAEKSELETIAGKSTEDIFFGVDDEPGQYFGSNQYLNGMAYRFSSTKNYDVGITSTSSITIVEQNTQEEALVALNRTAALRCSAEAIKSNYRCNMTQIYDNWVLVVTTTYSKAYHWISNGYSVEYEPNHETYLEQYLQKYPSTLPPDYKTPTNP
jgi:hypothetical protein